MQLFIEVGGVVLGLGALITGVFGMNLHNNMEGGHKPIPWPFILTCIGIALLMLLFVAYFFKMYRKLQHDTSSVHSFALLNNFFSYIDDLESHIFNKKIESSELKESVEKVTGLRITEREVEFLVKMMEGNREGVLEAEREEALQAQSAVSIWMSDR